MTETEVIKQYPDIKQSWEIVGIAFLSMIVFAIPYALAKDFVGDEASFFIYYILSMGAVFFIGHSKRKKLTGLDTYTLGFASWRIIVLVVFAAIGLQFGVVSPIVSLIPMPDFMKEVFSELAERTGVFSFLTIVIAAPLLEELIFRGIVLDGLLKKYTPTYAIMMSSVLFGVVHLNPWQFIAALVIGIFSGWVYYKTGNLALSILIHLINNLAGFLLMHYYPEEKYVDMPLTEFYGGMINMLLFTGGALLAAGIAIYWLTREFGNNVSEGTTRVS